MANIMKYKDYYTKIEYNIEDKVLHGKIEGINDLVNFESDSPLTIEQEFHSAVDDYLAYCKEIGKEPDKVYKGVFNVRINPELHKKSVMLAAKENRTLNQLVEIAISKYVSNETDLFVKK